MVRRPSHTVSSPPPQDTRWREDAGRSAADERAVDAAAYDPVSTMQAWERLLTAGQTPPGSPVRGLIERSWHRSAAAGVDARGRGSGVIAPPDEVERLKHQNADLLAAARRSLARLAEMLSDTATMVVVTDGDGVVLDATGDPHTIDAGHDIHLEIGASWAEGIAGTNGIGTALFTGKPVYVRATEHFSEGIKSWTCIGTPIFSPLDHSVIGVVDFSGPRDIYHRHNVALGMMAASHIELALAEHGRIERVRLLEAALSHLARAMCSDGFVLLDRCGRIVHHCDVAAARWKTLEPKAELRIGSRLLPIDGDRWEDGVASAAVPGSLTERLTPLMLDGTFSGAVLILPPAPRASLARPSVRTAASRAMESARAGIVGNSEALLAAIARAERAAQGKAPILLEGETGVGKELFARLIHTAGLETGKEPFVAFNCGAVTKDLIGAELFGHGPGAFTGASRDGRPGRLEAAHGGLLSLDEIGEMPLDLQPYLLRVLEERAVYRIGENRPRPVAVRLVACTNRDLRREVAAGRFRKDLYFRIGAIKIAIPPLRERHGDVPLLIEHFNRIATETYAAEPLRFRPEAMELLERYSWPGNVRELRNMVESLFLMSTSRLVGLEDFPEELVDELRGASAQAAADTDRSDGRSGTPAPADGEIARIDETERRLVERALERSQGNTSLAAAQLGISRSTLYRKLQAYRVSDAAEADKPDHPSDRQDGDGDA